MSFGKKVVELAIKDREIARLEEQIRELQPRKRKKVKRDLNQEFISLAEIAIQRNISPEQRIVNTQETIEVAIEEVESDAEDDSELEDSIHVKRRKVVTPDSSSEYVDSSE